MTSSTFIIGGTVREAREWCRQNGVKPYAHTTIIATHERALRGHTIRREDRIVWLDRVSPDLDEAVTVARLAEWEQLTGDDIAHLLSLGVKCAAPVTCPKCGKPEDSFACRIRHIHMNTGDAKASRDIDGGSR